MLPYKQEWTSKNFKSNVNRPFRFDGYFQDLKLIVEFNGYQHYVFPNVWIKHKKDFLELKNRDKIKEEMVKKFGNYLYLKIQENESYDNIKYIKKRLEEIGVNISGIKYDLSKNNNY